MSFEDYQATAEQWLQGIEDPNGSLPKDLVVELAHLLAAVEINTLEHLASFYSWSSKDLLERVGVLKKQMEST